MAERFVDRVATQPNRYKIIPADGAEYYATLERADEPSEMGTPLNAEHLNVFVDHMEDTSNPHGVTYSQVGAAPELAYKFTPEWAKTHQARNDVMNILTNGNLDAENMHDSYIATEDASTLVNSPVTSGAFRATREVKVIPNGSKYDICVTLYETYPVAGRIWTRLYDGSNWTPKWQDSFDFAPSGYGLGETLGKYCTDCFSIDKGGLYYVDANTANIPEGVIRGVVLAMITKADTTKEPILMLISGANVAFSYYSSYAGSYQPWGWMNPPMALGVEYRTTERHNGYVVYTKLIKVGAGPSSQATPRYFAHKIPLTQAIRTAAYTGKNGDTLHMWNGQSGSQVNAYTTSTYIILSSSYDASKQEYYAQVWYTKD